MPHRAACCSAHWVQVLGIGLRTKAKRSLRKGRTESHEGAGTRCDAAFAYVNAFTAHVDVGFFRGAELPDPKHLMEGTGKFMRHVELGPGREVDAAALELLISAAYNDMKRRLEPE